jgi:hypothetical protein
MKAVAVAHVNTTFAHITKCMTVFAIATRTDTISDTSRILNRPAMNGKRKYGRKTMADYISRQAALDACFDGWNNSADDCARNIKSIPAADVAPVVHGRWKKKKDSDLFYCSECELPSMHKWPYCERCGAKMDDERKG